MAILKSQLNTASETFKENAEVMQALSDNLGGVVEQIKLGGGERYQKRHHETSMSFFRLDQEPVCLEFSIVPSHSQKIF